MKKIIFSLLCVLIFCATNAQSQMDNPNGSTLDTASQAAAEGPTLQVKGYRSTLSITLPVTKISGTITGTVKWQGSNDEGTTWYTIDSTVLRNQTDVYGWSEAPKKMGLLSTTDYTNGNEFLKL